MKKQLPNDLRLEYLREYSLGGSCAHLRRNVPLRVGNVPNLEMRLQYFNYSTFAWKLARRLEGREHVSDSEGIWPSNSWRCERKFGLPGNDIFPRDASLESATPAIWQEAFEMRRLCYIRVANSHEAKNVISTGHEVRYATEITSDWYDPPVGTIVADEERPIIGAHAVPLIKFDISKGEFFVFPNSWSEEWGFQGIGAISTEHFDRFIIEAWLGVGLGLHVPYESKTGIICLEWKWSLTDTIGVHVREIVDAETSERLAWAFCHKRDNYLDVEEFYVWPSERGKGYARELARMVSQLSLDMNRPLRMLISHADTEPENRSGLESVARLLGLNIAESDQRWIPMIGVESPLNVSRPFSRPQRPAFMLERLRPKDEQPIDTPIEYSVVFGTNRCLIAEGRFGTQRGETLYTGISRITIPRSHRFGSKGRAWVRWWNWLTGKNPKVLENRVFVDEAEFASAVSAVLSSREGEKQNLLYVHGFNVSFESAMLQAAYFGVDLKIPGVTFAFSWPSAGSLKAYMADEAAVEASLPHFEEFLHRVLRATLDVPLNIIVHSMGNRAVLRVLDAIAREQTAVAHGRIQNVILAAPDVDTDVFSNTMQRIVSLPSRTTLYATRADLALQASEWLHSHPRAGLFPPVVTLPGMDTILVEGFNLLNLAHGYYSEASSVLHDMFVLLHYESAPDSRPALIGAQTENGALFWKLQV